MAGANLKRPSYVCGDTHFKRAQASAAGPDTQARNKENKTSNLKDTAKRALQSHQSEALIEAANVDVNDFADDGNAWNPFASQIIRAVEQVKKADHWPREFATSVKERQTALLEELQVKSQAITARQQQFTSQFQHVIAAALVPVGIELPSASPGHPFQIKHVTPHGQPLYEKTNILLEESKHLLAQYRHQLAQHHQLQQQHSETSRLEDLSKNFAADKDKAARAIAAGRRVADVDIDDMLADKLHQVRGGSRKATTTSTIAIDEDNETTLGREVLQIGLKKRPDLADVADAEGWGNVAHRAQRAVEKLCKVNNLMEE